MEQNEGYGKLPAIGNNIELEKFKRRLIRAVSRMLVVEKRNEEEVWNGLRKETGCDCKELWSRMHALTIKKLDRLLKVEDRVDKLPKAARMSITDWLLFDTVLVHEDFDVTGMTETTSVDKKILTELFDLVEKHSIELLAGDQLTDAWLKVTLDYNSDGRQCTPMLLQRRWYQLKLATRARFYKFWSIYKGVTKRQSLAEAYKPTALQATIALRYKPLVVAPFMFWEDLIKNSLVVLPDAFERKGNLKSSQISDDTDPDVMCLEPAVETITLDTDSDQDLEYRNSPETNTLPPVIIKQEPADNDEISIEENVPYQNRQEKISHFAEAVMEATAMELDEIELSEDIDSFLSPKPSETSEIPTNSECEHSNENSNLDQTNLKDSVQPVIEENNKTGDIENEINTNLENVGVTIETNPTLATSEPIISTILEIEQPLNQLESKDNDTNIQEDTEPVLPQITSIFGGVDVTNETLSKISQLTALSKPSTTTLNKEGGKVEEIKNPESIPVDDDSSDELILLDDAKTEEINSSITKDTDIKTEHEINVVPDTNKNNWFGELSNDIDFADDGIQLVDDGIPVIDDDSAYEMNEIRTKMKSEIEIEEMDMVSHAKNEDVPKVDEKLLMVPVVSMVKLDDMDILPVNLLSHINNKYLIDLIISKNLPVKTKKVKLETIKKDILEPHTIKKEKQDFETNDENVTKNVKTVKLTSNLLKKPRYRTYTSIHLCKNPDFNTRLKKLNVGFFSSHRNRLLLKACKPLTIDVSKAFEQKLVSGTLYLETNNSEDLPKDTSMPKQEEHSQNSSVLPSAMAVQSLIDNTRGDIPPSSYTPNAPRSTQADPVTSERNKVIKLPDITEIRRINNKLLVAEVTPLRVRSGATQVPVTLIRDGDHDNPSQIYTKAGKAIAGPASKTRITPQVVDITKEKNSKDNSQTKNGKDSLNPKYKMTPWKPKLKAEIPWYSNKNFIYANDTLLALDSLNKMLYLITEGEEAQPFFTGKFKNKGKKKVSSNDTLSVNTTKDNDVEIVSETKLDKVEAKKSRNRKNAGSQKVLYCCWARERICQMIFAKRKPSKHNCPYPLCLCCCRYAMLEFMRKNGNKGKSTEPVDVNCEPNNTGTVDVTNVNEKKDLSTDVAEIIPIQDISSNVQEATVSTAQSAVKSVVNTDRVACENDNKALTVPNQQSNSSEVDIGAEISVTTSEKTVIIDLEKSTESNDNEIPKLRPHFRIKSLSKKNTGKQKRKIIVNRVVSGDSANTPIVVTPPTVAEPPVVATPVESTPTLQMLTRSKALSNQKQIYLNSKQISQLPSDNPIFLGKNKILMTTAIFPPNFKAFESFQANIKNTLAIPKGIQLVLLPSGRITYVRDRKTDVSEEFLEKLPEIISAIQNQINLSIAPSGVQQTEVIDLSEDETTNVAENTEKQFEVKLSVDNVNGTIVTETSQPEKNYEVSKSAESPLENGDGATVPEKLRPEENKSDENPVLNMVETESSENPNKNTSDETTATAVTDENSGKSSNKNILSDLMAMSGIEPTDIAAAAKECLSPEKIVTTENTENVIHEIVDCENSATQSIQHPLAPPALQPISPSNKADETPGKTKMIAKPLTSITSLAELKYACAQSGLFFKLDLDTGLLMPINVCMKKFTDANRKKQSDRQLNGLEPQNVSETIDLTEENSEVVNATQVETNNADNNDEVASSAGPSANLSNIVITPTGVSEISVSVGTGSFTIDPSVIGNNVNKDGHVKPLKLFKSSVSRPSILERRLKEIQKRITETKRTEDSIRRKLKRKQEIRSLLRSDALNEESDKISTDDSSDEEPLAKKATKIRATEKSVADEEINQNIHNAPANETVSELQTNSTLFVENQSVDLPPVVEVAIEFEPPDDVPMDVDEDMNLEILEEPILNEGAPEEDCILGV